MKHKDLQVHSFKTKKDFFDWLAKNYQVDQPFWLRYFKVASKRETISPSEAVDVALCWGWIDGLINKYDDESYLVRFSQRRKRSVWSKVNVAKVEKLIASGEMQPSGMILVEEAKVDGRWAKAY